MAGAIPNRSIKSRRQASPRNQSELDVSQAIPLFLASLAKGILHLLIAPFQGSIAGKIIDIIIMMKYYYIIIMMMSKGQLWRSAMNKTTDNRAFSVSAILLKSYPEPGHPFRRNSPMCSRISNRNNT